MVFLLLVYQGVEGLVFMGCSLNGAWALAIFSKDCLGIFSRVSKAELESEVAESVVRLARSGPVGQFLRYLLNGFGQAL